MTLPAIGSTLLWHQVGRVPVPCEVLLVTLAGRVTVLSALGHEGQFYMPVKGRTYHDVQVEGRLVGYGSTGGHLTVPSSSDDLDELRQQAVVENRELYRQAQQARAARDERERLHDAWQRLIAQVGMRRGEHALPRIGTMPLADITEAIERALGTP